MIPDQKAMTADGLRDASESRPSQFSNEAFTGRLPFSKYADVFWFLLCVLSLPILAIRFLRGEMEPVKDGHSGFVEFYYLTGTGMGRMKREA